MLTNVIVWPRCPPLHCQTLEHLVDEIFLRSRLQLEEPCAHVGAISRGALVRPLRLAHKVLTPRVAEPFHRHGSDH